MLTMKAEAYMKNWLIGAVIWGAMASTSLKADQHNPDPEGGCITNWCQVVHCPTGVFYFTNIVFWPNTNVCLGAQVLATPNMEATCDDARSVILSAPQTTNCLPAYFTNECVWPVIMTNWWVVSGPNFQASGEGLGINLVPTNCGQYSVSFNQIWKNPNPCGYTNLCPGGSTSISSNFTVVNVDIAETEKKICTCDSTGFSLTNTCFDVTWEVVSQEVPGEPTVDGSSIVAGTNCGTWQIIARSTVNTNCADYASLHVFGVAGLSPAGLSPDGTNQPPTYFTCPRGTNAVDRWLRVTATPCPWVSEEESCTNLPPCWQMTGGHRPVMVTNDCVNRLAVEVDLSQMGTHTVTAGAGCSSNTVVIIVQDTNPPSINCRDLWFPTDPGYCSAIVDLYDYIWPSDNCEVVDLTFDPDEMEFPKGTNTVTATATDVGGNTTNCTFNVIVYDNESPVVTCSGNITNCASASGTNIVTWTTPTASDNCQVTNIACSPPSGSDFPVGETTVTCTALDSSGNPGTCTFTVTVRNVEFLDASKSPINALRVAKWENGFDTGPTVRTNFIDLDPDRFHVRVNDQSKKGSGKVSVKLSTDSAGTDYDDDATEIELAEEPANSGIFISTNMLMVSDNVDDDFTNPNVVADDTKNDRTHKIALGGKVKVQYPETGTVICEKEANVPPSMKTVQVSIVVLNVSGSPVTPLSTVSNAWLIAKERYAQVGIQLQYSIAAANQPAGVDLSDGLDVASASAPTWTQVAQESKNLISALGTTNTTADIHAFYVNTINAFGSSANRGVAIADYWFDESDENYIYNFMVASSAGPFTAPHELGHLVGDNQHHADQWNLMRNGTSLSNGVTESKRLDATQESRMRGDSHAQ